MQIHNFPQHSDEWFSIRAGKFTSSVANTIKTAGQGLETLCFDIVAEILTKKKKETFKSPAMEQGNELEDTARTLFEMMTGFTVKEVGFVEIDEFEGSSPDGIFELDGEMSGVEFKCPQDNTFAKLLYDRKIKPEYYAQMQHQMMCLNANRWFYAVFNPNFEEQMIIIEVEKDAEFQAKLRDGLEKGKSRVKEILNQIKGVTK
jgi:predicted phage-related endonuclease